MAMTRKALKAMGLTDEQVDSIVEMHTDTVEKLKDELKTVQEKADKLDGVQKELDDLKAAGSDNDNYKDKYEKEKKDFADYKADIEAKQARANKEAAVRAYFEGKKITGANLEIALKAAHAEIDAVELDGEKIKDATALDGLVSGTLSGLVVKTSTQGANTSTPPANGGNAYKSKADIMAIKDTKERQKAIAENHELFGF